MNRSDPNGDSPTLAIMAIGGLIGAGINFACSVITQKNTNGSINFKTAGIAAASGFVSGAVAASPLGAKGQVISSGIISGLSYAADCWSNNEAMTLAGAASAVFAGVISGKIGGKGANCDNVLTNSICSTRKVIARESNRANQKYAAKVVNAAISSRNNQLSLSFWDFTSRFSIGSVLSNKISYILK